MPESVQALATFFGLAAGAWFAAHTVNRWPKLRGVHRLARWALAALAAVVGAFGGVVVAIGLTGAGADKPDLSLMVLMTAFGLAVLLPFFMLFRKPGRVAPAVEQKSIGVPSLFVPAAPEQKPTAVPPVPPAFVPAPAPAAFVPSSGFDDDDDDGESPFAAEYQFNYESPEGDVDERVAFITHLSQSGGQLYFEGRRTDTNEARSYRVDRVVGNMIDTYSGTPYEAELLADLFGPPVARDTAQFMPAAAPSFQSLGNHAAASARSTNWRTGVCFLGFGYAKESELTDLAEDADWMVFGDVSRHVDYVVLNGRAGARQRQRAEDAGATVIDEETFRGMV